MTKNVQTKVFRFDKSKKLKITYTMVGFLRLISEKAILDKQLICFLPIEGFETIVILQIQKKLP